jgi:hypothetical protein
VKRSNLATFIAGPLATLLLFCGALSAQNIKVNGLITGRKGATMTVQTASEPKLVALLTDDTQVAQVQGILKATRKQMSMAALIPGLQVQVEVPYNAENQLVASSVNFKGNDLEDAQTIQAGLQPAKEQIEQSNNQSTHVRCHLA